QTATEGDVEMNKGEANCTFFLVTSNDFASAVTHEVGHAIGFRHSDQDRTDSAACPMGLDCTTMAIMNHFIPGGLNAALQTWDQSAVRTIYPNFSGTAPTGLAATATTTTSVSLTWNTTGAPSYHVYRSANGITWLPVE